jgi:hypothetical protein
LRLEMLCSLLIFFDVLCALEVVCWRSNRLAVKCVASPPAHISRQAPAQTPPNRSRLPSLPPVCMCLQARHCKVPDDDSYCFLLTPPPPSSSSSTLYLFALHCTAHHTQGTG